MTWMKKAVEAHHHSLLPRAKPQCRNHTWCVHFSWGRVMRCMDHKQTAPLASCLDQSALWVMIFTVQIFVFSTHGSQADIYTTKRILMKAVQHNYAVQDICNIPTLKCLKSTRSWRSVFMPFDKGTRERKMISENKKKNLSMRVHFRSHSIWKIQLFSPEVKKLPVFMQWEHFTAPQSSHVSPQASESNDYSISILTECIRKD